VNATLAELEQRRDALLAQERLLRDALGNGLAGRQRQVQRALLADTRRDLAIAGRALRAVRAGWDPFEPSAEWHRGFVEDPRFLGGRVRLVSIVAAAVLAILSAALLALRIELLAAAATSLVIGLGLQAALHELLGRIGAKQGPNGDVRLFNAPMPAHAAVAYRRAQGSGLFDTFVVASPRAEDFCSVQREEAPSLGLLDPVLLGVIGQQHFLIAQWDLAKDLEAYSK